MQHSSLVHMSINLYKNEQSFGIVPFKKIDGNWHVLLIRHARAKFWGFPKGHPEDGENPLETAIRELKEETNLKLEKLLSDKSFEEKYQFRLHGQLINKTVNFFAAVVAGDVVLQEVEVSESQWVPIHLAEDVLTYDADIGIMRQAAKLVV